MDKQRVTFRKFKKGGEVIAFFLDQPERDTGTCMSYMHIGQHSAAMYPHDMTVPATESEYAPLLAELAGIVGYDDLRIVKRGRIAA